MTLKECRKSARNELSNTGWSYIWICYSKSKGYYHYPISAQRQGRPNDAKYLMLKDGRLEEI